MMAFRSGCNEPVSPAARMTRVLIVVVTDVRGKRAWYRASSLCRAKEEMKSSQIERKLRCIGHRRGAAAY